MVRAENPSNIGQSARAMKSFGVDQLILVNCAFHRVPEAYTPGWKGRKILDRARRINSLDQALRGRSLAIGFTARAGKRRGEPRSLFDIVPETLKVLRTQRIALVFGNEKSGLSNAELKKCHWMATIPAVSEYTSFNLSHAVAIVLATLYMQLPVSRNLFKKPKRFHTKPEEFEALMDDFRYLLKKLRYKNTLQVPMINKVMTGFSHYFKRAGLDRRELHLFKAFLSKIRQII